MNIMIAAVGIDSGFGVAGGTAEGALFVAVFAAVGCVLLLTANQLMKRYHRPHDVRYTAPRL